MPAVILATAGYDHTIRFWDPSGICYRTIQYADSVFFYGFGLLN
jgi:G protein beta subunit-like protein